MKNLSELKDEELVSHYLEGDNSAFEEIVNRYLKPVYNFTYRFCGNEKDSEEIVQESFLKLWKNIKKFRKNDKFKTWFYTIARNTAIDWMRKKKSIVFSKFENEKGENFFEDSLTDTEDIASEIFEKNELKKDVGKLIGALPFKYREIILLYYQEELSLVEISEVLKKPLNTVKSLHRRALILLRKEINNAPK